MTSEPGTASVPQPDGDTDTAAPPEGSGWPGPQRGPAGRRSRPTTVSELIDYAYGEAGRKLQLARRDLRGLVLRPDAAEFEMERLRESAAGDPLLSVPPRILVALAELGAEPRVRQRILELVLAALVNHPVFSPLVEPLAEPGVVPELSSARVSDAARDVTSVSLGLDAADFKEAAQERLRVNAVTSFALFRVLRDGWTLERFVAEMASAMWVVPPLDRTRVAENAAAMASAHDPDVLALLVRHFEGVLRDAEERTRHARGDAARATRCAERLEEENRSLSGMLESERSRTQDLSAQVADLTRDVEAERTNRVVDKSHLVDDYEVLRTQVIRRLSSQIELLSDGLHALRSGSTGVAEEFLDRSLTAIQGEVYRLKDLGGGTK